MKNKVVYATWIMTWISDRQSWWESEMHCGSKIKINDGWHAHNWNDEAHVGYLLREIKRTGVNLIVSDLTNGLQGWEESLVIQKKCLELGLDFCVAFNHQGKKHYFEEQAQRVLDMFAGDKAICKEAYAYKDGKPLIITYVLREWLESIANSESKYLDIFNIEWASGEDPEVNKWGWQYDPSVGPISSKDSMLISPSIKWAIDERVWRKSLAWFDFNFLRAIKNNAKYRIISSFDDIQERNSWYIADTTLCERPTQLRDIHGKISVDAYYKRVCQWIEGKPQTIPGGIIPDGAYRLRSKSIDLLLNTVDNSALVGSQYEMCFAYAGLNYNFWFYHLGENIYRIIKLNSGLSICDLAETIIQVYDDDCDNQKWHLKKEGDDYLLVNVKSKRALGTMKQQVVSIDSLNNNCKWILEEVLTIGNRTFSI